MTDVMIMAGGLRFPEGPVTMADGSVLVVEIAGGTLTRISAQGEVRRIAQLGGGPNGLAIGPDRHAYVCNNGGFSWHEENGALYPSGTASDYVGGSIQRVDLATGDVTTLYDQCGAERLKGPNDIVFDGAGGFWFTDFGKRYPRTQDIGAIYYARCDGSFISEQIYPFVHGNGIALSPDGGVLYVSQSPSARLYRFEIVEPGVVRGPADRLDTSSFLYASPLPDVFDSMALEAEGNICVATCFNGGITVVSPDGRLIEHVPMPDPATTNIAFGGPDMRTAFVTLSATGRLAVLRWPRPGLPTAFSS